MHRSQVTQTGPVHNLQTEKGVYVAAGVLVHNCQLFAAKTFFAAIDPFPARYRFGVSADHRRKDKCEFLIHDLFGDVALHIKHESLVESGHVLDVEFRVIPTDFRAEWYGPNEDEEARDDYDIMRLVKEMQDDPDRNRIVLRAARDLVAEGDQVLVLAHLREHCMVIDQALSGRGTKTGLLLGGDESIVEFKRTEQGLRDGTLKAGIGTYKAITLGFDLPRLGAALCATPIAANEQIVKQVRGRVCRTSTGKTGARMVYIWDRYVPTFESHLENLARWNANTVVWQNAKWIPAKAWLKTNRAA